ncbi:TPA: hypothetical protein N0F65_003257 [Lagenidium giganteum]|uniref:Uncharacterized protein n=1 Tax=Lagenidium giganteum TaxID=4803 RepID=A0AAV2YM95_9STRA|nr:TPA: hypothetical protein N0F65_003257 [Lagenidium giganteum]
MKRELQRMRLDGMKPNCIRLELMDRFSLSSDSLPSLAKIQNHVYHYKRSALAFSDFVEGLQQLLLQTACRSSLRDDVPFTFGYDYDYTGSAMELMPRLWLLVSLAMLSWRHFHVLRTPLCSPSTPCGLPDETC